jgi:hypothetical protein
MKPLDDPLVLPYQFPHIRHHHAHQTNILNPHTYMAISPQLNSLGMCLCQTLVELEG